MTKAGSLSQAQLKKLLNEVIAASEETGRKLLRFQKHLGDLKISSKEAQGVVSNADITAEKYLIKRLKSLVEGAEFLAEESAFEKFGGKSEAFKAYADIPYVWVIDPLDGTTNFLNNMDYYGVCTALVHYGEPILGVVHRPRTGQSYYALKGAGSFLVTDFINKKGELKKKKAKLELPSTPKKLKNSLLVTGFACEKGQEFDSEFKIFLSMMKNCRGIRRMGSAALDMCLVAEGIFDAFWERGLAPWDMAASSLIASEAGAFVGDYNAKAFNPFLSTIVVSNKKIKKPVLEQINQ